MEKFNLEEALAGNPVVTRDGKRVTELHFFKSNVLKPLIAVIDNIMVGYSAQGKYSPGNDKKLLEEESPYDLFMAPTKKSIWVNVYDDGDSLYLSKVKYTTEEECLNNITRKNEYVKTIEITND